MRGQSPRGEIFTAISPLKPLIFEAILPFVDPPDCTSDAAKTGSRQCSCTDSSGPTRWYRIFPSLLSDASSSLLGMLPPQIATTPLDDALHAWVRGGFS